MTFNNERVEQGINPNASNGEATLSGRIWAQMTPSDLHNLGGLTNNDTTTLQLHTVEIGDFGNTLCNASTNLLERQPNGGNGHLSPQEARLAAVLRSFQPVRARDRNAENRGDAGEPACHMRADNLTALGTDIDRQLRADGHRLSADVRARVDATLRQFVEAFGETQGVTRFNRVMNQVIPTNGLGLEAGVRQNRDGSTSVTISYGQEREPRRPNQNRQDFPHARWDTELYGQQSVALPSEAQQRRELERRRDQAATDAARLTPQQANGALLDHVQRMADIVRQNQGNESVMTNTLGLYVSQNRFALNALAQRTNGERPPLNTLGDSMAANQTLRNSNYELSTELFRGLGGGNLTVYNRRSGTMVSSFYAGTLLSSPER